MHVAPPTLDALPDPGPLLAAADAVRGVARRAAEAGAAPADVLRALALEGPLADRLASAAARRATSSAAAAGELLAAATRLEAAAEAAATARRAALAAGGTA